MIKSPGTVIESVLGHRYATYAESQGDEYINWEEELEDRYPDWHRLFSLADNWITGATGQCDARIPHVYATCAPDDPLLYDLDIRFQYAIESCDRQSALDILVLVKNRERELLAYIK